MEPIQSIPQAIFSLVEQAEFRCYAKTAPAFSSSDKYRLAKGVECHLQTSIYEKTKERVQEAFDLLPSMNGAFDCKQIEDRKIVCVRSESQFSNIVNITGTPVLFSEEGRYSLQRMDVARYEKESSYFILREKMQVNVTSQGIQIGELENNYLTEGWSWIAKIALLAIVSLSVACIIKLRKQLAANEKKMAENLRENQGLVSQLEAMQTLLSRRATMTEEEYQQAVRALHPALRLGLSHSR